MASELTKIAQKRNQRDYEILSRSSVLWLKNKVKALTNPGSIASSIVAEKSRNKRIVPGNLYFFYYDPKNAAKLPYYDTFPLVLVLDVYPDGLTGLNFHYLPILMRAAFLDKLMDYTDYSNEDDTRRFRVSYDILNATKRLVAFRPCIKKYLVNHMGCRPLKVEPHEWETSLFLPVENFQKKQSAQVQRESIEKMNNDYLKQFKPKEA